jgi:hypothetical protein
MSNKTSAVFTGELAAAFNPAGMSRNKIIGKNDGMIRKRAKLAGRFWRQCLARCSALACLVRKRPPSRLKPCRRTPTRLGPRPPCPQPTAPARRMGSHRVLDQRVADSNDVLSRGGIVLRTNANSTINAGRSCRGD